MNRKQHIKKLDILWSLVIRSKKKCELTGEKGVDVKKELPKLMAKIKEERIEKDK